jgi:hypothetical protein
MARKQPIVTSLSFLTCVFAEMHNIYSCNSELHDAREAEQICVPYFELINDHSFGHTLFLNPFHEYELNVGSTRLRRRCNMSL